MFIVATLCAFLPLEPPMAKIASRFEQLAPAIRDADLERSRGQLRAVVLIHGFVLHTTDSQVRLAELRPWQQSGTPLVKRLAPEADVFAFAYGQDGTIEDVVHHTKLQSHIKQLRNLGYREIVLLGHSAGGLIARHLVEDYPDLGITKVIQLCSPNGGTSLAKTWVVPRAQRKFIEDLSIEKRKQSLRDREDKKIPSHVEFICVLGRKSPSADSDGVVLTALQWTPDLRDQGIPVIPLTVSHRQAVFDQGCVAELAWITRTRQPRWSPDLAARTSRVLLQK